MKTENSLNEIRLQNSEHYIKKPVNVSNLNHDFKSNDFLMKAVHLKKLDDIKSFGYINCISF